jgi:hypothetical protein
LGAGALSGFEKGSETPDRKGAIGEKKVTLGHVSPKRSVLRPYVAQLGEVRDFYPLSHNRSTNFKQTQICQTKRTTPHLAKLLLAVRLFQFTI